MNDMTSPPLQPPARPTELPVHEQPERKASAWLGAPAHAEPSPAASDIDRMLHA